MMRIAIAAASALCLLSSEAAAQGTLRSFLLPPCGPRILVTFEDAYPDVLTITNLSPPGWTIDSLTIDLQNSYGGVVFDTVPGSIGLEMTDNFYRVRNDATLRMTAAKPLANNRVMSLYFDGFGADRSFSFLVDLDDTARISANGRNTVTFGEMSGTRVTARMHASNGYPTDIRAVFAQMGIADSGGTAGCP